MPKINAKWQRTGDARGHIGILAGRESTVETRIRSRLGLNDPSRNFRKSLETLAKTARLSNVELGDALGIPQSTLARRKNQGTLTAEESAKVVRLARCISRASGVFGDLDNAVAWLKHPNRALGGVTPISLLDTDVGMEAVSDLLGRIEHGVFS